MRLCPLRGTTSWDPWYHEGFLHLDPKLHAAIRAALFVDTEQRLDSVRQLLDSGAADVNECNSSCQTALHVAAQCHDVQLVRLLLDRGAAVHAVDQQNNTPLQSAVLSGSIPCAQVIRQLLQAGADIHCSTGHWQVPCAPWGRTTVLHLAAQKGDVGTVRALLAAGVSPNVLDQRRQAPLFLAAATSNAATVEALVCAGADVSAGGPACQCNRCNRPVQLRWENMGSSGFDCVIGVQTAVAHHSVLHVANVAPILPAAVAAADMAAAADAMPPHAAAGASAAALEPSTHIAAAEAEIVVAAAAGATSAHDTSMGTDLIAEVATATSVEPAPASCCNVDAQDRVGNTALHYAAALGRTHTLKALLAAGAAVNAVNHAGCTALHMAFSGPCCCTPSCSATVQLLLAAGADVTLPDVRGRGALHLSAMLVDLGTLQQLLAAGADANAPTNDRETPLLLVGCGPGRPDQDMQPPAESMLLAAESEHPAARTWQHQHVLPTYRHSAKRVAACMQCLLNAGARPSIVALHKAASRGWAAAVQLLLSAGMDMDGPDAFGDTALHKAACSDARDDAQLAVMQVLLSAGADVAARNVSGFTPLHGACGQAKPEAVQLLLASGANVAATAGPYRETALHTALQVPSDRQYSRRHVQVVQLLLDAGADAGAVLDGLPEQGALSGMQPLHLAINPHYARAQIYPPAMDDESASCTVQILQQLLAAGADVDATDAAGTTALSLAMLDHVCMLPLRRFPILQAVVQAMTASSMSSSESFNFMRAIIASQGPEVFALLLTYHHQHQQPLTAVEVIELVKGALSVLGCPNLPPLLSYLTHKLPEVLPHALQFISQVPHYPVQWCMWLLGVWANVSVAEGQHDALAAQEQELAATRAGVVEVLLLLNGAQAGGLHKT